MLGEQFFKMEGNKKVGITAEFVAIIKAKQNTDYDFFVSRKARVLFNFFNFFFRKTLNRAFDSRLKLSNEFDRIIQSQKFSNIVDLGAGFSLRGFNTKKINYYDLDFPEVIESKKIILRNICALKNKKFPINYHLIPADLLGNYFIPRKGKSIFLAEGVASYFSQPQFEIFISNVFNVLSKGDVFLYNEKWSGKNSFSYALLRGFVGFISRNKPYVHFNSKEQAKKYFLSKGFSKFNVFEKGGFNIIKLVK